jgi:restriction system protein
MEIDAFEADYRRGVQDAVAAYCSMVLEASQYPSGFPQQFKLAYVPGSRQVVVEYELPTVTVVPAVKAYKYVKTSDTITETARPQTQIKTLYASVVAQVAIRTVHELLQGDSGGHVDTVVFNGVVDTTDPGSGRRVHPCLVTVRTTRDTFRELDLAHVEPLACLKHLSAGVSKSPSELAPVRPVLEFSMVDPRFIAESDALSELDQRPNLMDLSPTEFEALIQNLFTKMGLEARQTRASRDGGVDCVAWDPRPIFGGKVVIQAKRYKNTVGVSAVRDLYGTLQNEGASKGILVATSGYGKASFEFAQNKPIELIDGANLLYLLKEHAGIEAKIEPPDTWKDPVADSPEYPGE